MTVLRIEHKTQSYEGWKKVFDSDPIGREKSGVKRYYIYRPVDDENYVIIDLVFENRADADAALAALKKVWSNVEGAVIFDPQTRILDVVEYLAY